MSTHLDELEALLKEASPGARIIMYEDAMWLLGLVREAAAIIRNIRPAVTNWGMEESACNFCGAEKTLRGRINHKEHCALKQWLARLERGPQ